MLFLPIVLYFQNFCATHPIKIGINYHSKEWSIAYYMLAKTANSVISGDYSNYDGTIPKFVGEKVLEFINQWYDDDPKYQRARKVLFDNIYDAKYVFGNDVYEIKDGNPSGNPITSIYNSLCNMVILYSVLYDKVDMQQTSFAVYGDDAVVTTMTPGIEVETLAEPIKTYFGMLFTHWTKKEVIGRPPDTLDTISFLSRQFVRGPYNLILAPLPLDTICHSTYWYKKNGPAIVTGKQTVLTKS